MNLPSSEKVGGFSLIEGSIFLAVYSVLYQILLPSRDSTHDFVSVVSNPNWTGLALLSFLGILLMMVGFHVVYSKLHSKAGVPDAIGFFFIEAAYLFQACKVTWELFIYPIIASQPGSAFLLRDDVIKHDPAVIVFRLVASVTIFIGIILFCRTLYRSEEYPKVAAVLIFAGAFVYGFGPLISLLASIAGIITLSIGCLLVGLRLFRVQVA